jgi:membrane protease YdiL (CAAX protease family)
MSYTRSRLLILTFTVEGIALLSAFLLAQFFDIRIFQLTEEPFRDISIGTIGALPILAVFVLSLTKKAKNIPVLGSLRKTLITEIRVIFLHMRFNDIFVISILAGIAEEILFRGVIQVKFGIIIASILFGVMHMVTPAYLIITIFMGFYLGILFQLYGSILVPIQLHFIYDFGALVYLKYFVKDDYSRE